MLQSLAYVANDPSRWLVLVVIVVCCLAIAGLIGAFAYRRQREQNSCLDTAINNMSQGLTMFDKSGRLVLCNQRYIELYGLSPEVVRPGCTVGRLVEHRVETGSLSIKEAEAYTDYRRAAVAQDRIVSNIAELPDGRTIVVTRRPMKDGGWVATHDDITARRQAEAQVAHLAHHDALTGLPNRVRLREQMDTELARVRRGQYLAVLFFDLDDFKSINDGHGHAVGDKLLRAVADRAQGCLRETDTIARFGGDEFAILQTGIDRPSDPAALAARVREAVAQPYDIDGHQLFTDISIGISLAPNDGTDPDQLLKHADLAMYEAKSHGRGTFRFFEPAMNARVKERRTLELDLRNAIANDGLELYYQPILDLERDEIRSCEALLRWHHPERGPVSPAEFIPVAEETGLISVLGEWILNKACSAAASWPGDVSVAVNVSSIQFKNQSLLLKVIKALAVSGLSARRLHLEITEGVLMRDDETTLATLHQLRELGVRIVMDDFGTGYSSLTYLRSFPFDKIKIDRSFIKDVSEMDDASAIVRAITSLASSLNMTTTAEGVETQEQLAKIRELGCTEMQGYLFSHPMTAEDTIRLLLSRAGGVAGAERLLPRIGRTDEREMPGISAPAARMHG
ncbi:MAG: EAL domain-containing protein [Bradyrhizobium sp.]|nr:EAL domain-containing protein [Bradyrhizobium sp.]